MKRLQAYAIAFAVLLPLAVICWAAQAHDALHAWLCRYYRKVDRKVMELER